ncbi:MAG: hypothetical protein HYV28_18060 [Ignavibacteriales bacterium]|nr:hypothetical protein [Ignavibacteriales bacterium]
MKNNICLLLIIIVFILTGCKKNSENPVVANPFVEPTKKTSIIVDNAILDYAFDRGKIVSLLSARITLTNSNPLVSFSLRETSPADTINLVTKGVFNSAYANSGLPVADEYWGVTGFFKKGDSTITEAFYEDLIHYSSIDSVIFEPYKLVGTVDTIAVSRGGLLMWKENYRIDTLRFKLYLKPALEINYDRFCPTTMNFTYKTAQYDSVKHIALFTVGIAKMSAEPKIVLLPFSKFDYNYENSFVKIITRFSFQEEWKAAPFHL